MNAFLISVFSLLLSNSRPSPTLPADSLREDSMRTDTMREVTIYSPQGLPVKKAIDRAIKKEREETVHIPSFAEIMEKLLPGINDKITHPFAFRARKREKQRLRRRRSLEHFDDVKTFEELVREAYMQQMLEDSTNAMKMK